MDEIGKMELLSDKFKQLIQTLIERPNLILVATIPIKPLAFVDRIRTRNDSHLLTVSVKQKGTRSHRLVHISINLF